MESISFRVFWPKARNNFLKTNQGYNYKQMLYVHCNIASKCWMFIAGSFITEKLGENLENSQNDDTCDGALSQL